MFHFVTLRTRSESDSKAESFGCNVSDRIILLASSHHYYDSLAKLFSTLISYYGARGGVVVAGSIPDGVTGIFH